MKFPAVEFLETVPKFRKRKKNSSWCVFVLPKTSDQEISRPSRAVTAKKCTKKCNARAELLFWLLFDVLVAVAVVVAKVPHCQPITRNGIDLSRVERVSQNDAPVDCDPYSLSKPSY